jgi:hypothetical protein
MEAAPGLLAEPQNPAWIVDMKIRLHCPCSRSAAPGDLLRRFARRGGQMGNSESWITTGLPQEDQSNLIPYLVLEAIPRIALTPLLAQNAVCYNSITENREVKCWYRIAGAAKASKSNFAYTHQSKWSGPWTGRRSAALADSFYLLN